MTANPRFEARVRTTFPEKADQILAVIRGTRAYALTYESAAQRNHESYYPHLTSTLKLEALNEILGTFGVEYIPAGRGRLSPALEYCNTGDLYAGTILYLPERRQWRVGSVGDWVERGEYD